jgi:hypothetical protein
MKIDEAFFFFFLTCLHNYGRSKRAFEEEKYVFFLKKIKIKIIIFIYLVSVRDLTMNLKE